MLKIAMLRCSLELKIWKKGSKNSLNAVRLDCVRKCCNSIAFTSIVNRLQSTRLHSAWLHSTTLRLKQLPVYSIAFDLHWARRLWNSIWNSKIILSKFASKHLPPRAESVGHFWARSHDIMTAAVWIQIWTRRRASSYWIFLLERHARD